MEIKRIAVDTSKAVFTVHGTDLEDHAILRRHFSRPAFEAFFAKQPSTDVALEACGGSHHWGRRLTEMGHRVRLIPPQYVKPFVKRGKNDRNDAEAICEATGRPGMSTVPVRAAEHQARAMIVGVRDLLVRQRTQVINALRGYAAEFGVIAAKGTAQVGALMERVGSADAAVPEAAQEMLTVLADQVAQLDGRIAGLDLKMRQAAAADETARRLMKVPTIGPVGALTLPDGRPGAVPLGPALRVLAGAGSQGTLDRRQAAAGRDLPGGERTAATAAGGGCHGSDPSCQAWQQERVALVISFAGTAAA